MGVDEAGNCRWNFIAAAAILLEAVAVHVLLTDVGKMFGAGRPVAASEERPVCQERA